MQLVHLICQAAIQIEFNSGSYVCLVRHDRLQAVRAKVLPRPAAHAMADHDGTIVEPFGEAGMVIRIPVPVMRMLAKVFATSPGMLGEGVRPQGLCTDRAVFDLNNGKER